MLAGYLIGTAIFSAISAALIKLSARVAAKTTVKFWTAFFVSAVSFFAALFSQMLFDGVRSQSSFIHVLPGVVFFGSCWLLSVQFIGYGEIDGQKSYTKAFLVTFLQCVGLFAISITFSILLFGILTAAISAV